MNADETLYSAAIHHIEQTGHLRPAEPYTFGMWLYQTCRRCHCTIFNLSQLRFPQCEGARKQDEIP